MKERINGGELREMLLCAYEALEQNKQAINELNVFPVPDGDTGTNMTLTISTAAQELQKLESDSVAVVADKAASAMLRGARGNSGVILSLLFRGIARGLKGMESCTAEDFALAMREGVEAAYKAVMKPAEGTILTVSKMASRVAVERTRSTDDVEEVLTSALAAALNALEETTQQNPVLARAGVVDAGGKGYVCILEAFLGSLQGRIVSGSVRTATEEERSDANVFGEFSDEEITFTYDTVYIMKKFRPEKPLDRLRTYLDSIGDSLVISEDDEIFKVHVHTDDPGLALTESAKYGVLDVAKIENMRAQHDALLAGQKPNTADALEDGELPAPTPELVPASKKLGFVAVCAGDGLSDLFRELGCDNVVTGGQTMNPSTADILAAVNRTPAEIVFVFPNNKNIIMAAEQCDPLTEKQVVVVPTCTVPQGITCLLNLDTGAEPEDLLSTFTEVMATVHTAQVTYAARDSGIDGLDIRAGEYLGLLDGALLGAWNTREGMTAALTEAVAPLEPEFITVYRGEDVSEEEARPLVDSLVEAFPDADVTLVDGGQPVYYYMISIE